MNYNFALGKIFFVSLLLIQWEIWGLLSPSPCSSEEICEICKEVLPQASVFKKDGPPPHYKAFQTNPKTNQPELAGIVFTTTDIAPSIKGFAGPIQILVGIDPHGTIKGLKILSHSETEQYVGALESFLKQFISLSSNNNLELGKDIDGITQATITSQAITRSIKESLNIIERDVLNKKAAFEESKNTPANTPFPIGQVIFPLIIFFIATFAIFKTSPVIRWISMVGAFLYLGLIKNSMLSIVHFINLSLLRIPDFKIFPLWYSLVFLTIITSLLFGRVYCSSICPFAFVQELLDKINLKIKIRPSAKIEEYLRDIKYFLLAFLFLIAVALKNSRVAEVEVFIPLFAKNFSHTIGLFLILILIVSIFNFRFWCKYFCPTGALISLLAKISLFKIRAKTHCLNCYNCEKDCPTDAIKMISEDKVKIKNSECILCSRCIRNCPDNAFKYSYKNEKSR